MFKKLRIKFIALSMASLLAVLVVIMGAINVMNYRHVVLRADETLALLAENGGSFFMGDMRPPAPSEDDESDGDDDDLDDDLDDELDDDFQPWQFDRARMAAHRDFSAETPYESRYFSVLLDADGAEQIVDTGRIAAVDSLTAVEYAQSVFESGKTQGFLDD